MFVHACISTQGLPSPSHVYVLLKTNILLRMDACKGQRSHLRSRPNHAHLRADVTKASSVELVGVVACQFTSVVVTQVKITFRGSFAPPPPPRTGPPVTTGPLHPAYSDCKIGTSFNQLSASSLQAKFATTVPSAFAKDSVLPLD